MYQYKKIIFTTFILLLFTGFISLFAEGVSDNVYNKEPFSLKPEVILDLLSSKTEVNEGTHVHILYEKTKYTFDEEGRLTKHSHMVYQILNQTGVEKWSYSYAYWNPWHQIKPIIRARVITPDGQEYWLDPETIGDFSASEGNNNILSDRRILKAPLPSIEIGVIVEEEIIIQDLEPYFDYGTFHKYYFASYAPINRIVLEIEAPETLPLNFQKYLLPDIKIKEFFEGENRRIIFEEESVAAVETIEKHMPYDIPRWPHICFSTGFSWNEIASEYYRIVSNRTNQIDLSTIVQSIVSQDDTVEEKAEKLLAWIQDEIRYTGLEFGEAAIIPNSPEEILERKYGDCKDKATLLIALLDQAGVTAYLALLRAGFDKDIEPDLPGFGGFNHAIVYIPHDTDIWIDPTSEFARVGELPLSDQGRYALITSTSTQKLIQTPISTPEDNQYVLTTEIFLNEYGRADIIEHTFLTGTFERSYRSYYFQYEENEIQESFESYSERVYDSAELVSWSISPPRDLKTNFNLTLEIKEADSGYTELKYAYVNLYNSQILHYLPDFILDTAEKIYDRRSSLQEEERQNDLLIIEPYIYKMIYKIHPPLGFEPVMDIESVIEYFGPAVFQTDVALEEDNVVTITFSFNTVKKIYTEDEVNELLKTIDEYYHRKIQTIVFNQTGELYLSSGKINEALIEINRLIALEPDNALHKSRFARALLLAGFGAIAREKALLAAEMAPEQYLTYQTLGFVLKHDLIGRFLEEGFDYWGAIDAFNQAISLNPDDIFSRINMALLLEYDENGNRFASKENLEKAIQQYEILRDEYDYTEYDDNLLVSYIEAGEMEKAKILAKSLSQTETRLGYLLLAITLLDGIDKALEEASKIRDSNKLQAALIKAGIELLTYRKYAESVQLLQRAIKGAQNAAALIELINKINKIQPHESFVIDNDNPAHCIYKTIITFVSDFNLEDLQGIFSRFLLPETDLSEEDIEEFKLLFSLALDNSNELEVKSYVDMFFSLTSFKTEGNDFTGYKIKSITKELFSPNETIEKDYFIVKEEGQYKILATSDSLSSAGKKILQFIDNGQKEEAILWLDWCHEILSQPENINYLEKYLFSLFWTEETDKGPEKNIRYAAACLLFTEESFDTTAQIFELGLNNETDEKVLQNIYKALSILYTPYEHPDKLLNLSFKYMEQFPEDEEAAVTSIISVYRLKENWDEYEQFIQKMLEKSEDNLTYLRFFIDLKEFQGCFEEAIQLIKQLIEMDEAGSFDYNSIAWDMLFIESDLLEALEYAQTAASISNYKDRYILHTLATVYAALGQPIEAYEILLQSIQADGENVPDSVDWYVIGLIAENYNLLDAAQYYYSLVEQPDYHYYFENSTYKLAQQQLQSLSLKKD